MVIKCKNCLEKQLLRILLQSILLSSLELRRRGRLARYDVCSSFFFFLSTGQRERDGQSPNQNLETFSSFELLNLCT